MVNIMKAAQKGESLSSIMKARELEYYGSNIHYGSKNSISLLHKLKRDEREELRDTYKESVNFQKVQNSLDNFLKDDEKIPAGEKAYRKAFIELMLEHGSYVDFYNSSYYGLFLKEFDSKEIFAMRECSEASISNFAGTFADGDSFEVGMTAEILKKSGEVEFLYAEVTLSDIVNKMRES